MEPYHAPVFSKEHLSNEHLAPTICGLQVGSKVNWNGNTVEYTGTGKCKYTGRTMAILKGQTPSWASEKPKEIYFQVEI